MMRLPRRRFLLIGAAVVSLLASAASAQQRTQTITVVDSQGNPVALAEVVVAAGEKTVVLVTDEAGRVPLDPALLQDAPVVHVEVSAIGYDSASLDVAPGAPADTILHLDPASGDSGEIVVQARRISRPFSPQTLSFLDFVTDPKAQADPILAVNNLPVSTNVTGNSRLIFRGHRASINRAYLNDTPVYEFSTGSDLDSSTANRSVFGLVVTDEVETYPGNPPAYLAGATGGVVRVLTPENKSSGTTVTLTDLGVSAGTGMASNDGGNFLALYGTLTDFSLHKAINPGLDRLYRTITSATGGGIGRLKTADGGIFNLFFQAEASNNSFPFTRYGAESLFRLHPTKFRSVVSASAPVSDFVISTNLGLTRSSIEEEFDRSRVYSTNVYGFASLDLAQGSSQDKLTFRVGLDAEYIDQTSDTGATASATFDRTFSSALRRVSGYGFATYRAGRGLTVSVGARRTIATNLKPATSLQASGTLMSPDHRHKLIVSIGSYGGTEVPTRAYYGPISSSRTTQLEANYSWKHDGNTIGISGFLSRDQSTGYAFVPAVLQISSAIDNLTGLARTTRSGGFEIYAKWLPFNGIEINASFAKIRQRLNLRGETLRGSNDYPAIIRGSVKYTTPAQTIYSVSLTSRAGEPYTKAIDVLEQNGSLTPVYEMVNGVRFPGYFSLDASVSHRVHLTCLPGTLLAFLLVNNLTNHRNASSQTFTLPGESLSYRTLSGRTLLFGITASF